MVVRAHGLVPWVGVLSHGSGDGRAAGAEDRALAGRVRCASERPAHPPARRACWRTCAARVAQIIPTPPVHGRCVCQSPLSGPYHPHPSGSRGVGRFLFAPAPGQRPPQRTQTRHETLTSPGPAPPGPARPRHAPSHPDPWNQHSRPQQRPKKRGWLDRDRPLRRRSANGSPATSPLGPRAPTFGRSGLRSRAAGRACPARGPGRRLTRSPRRRRPVRPADG